VTHATGSQDLRGALDRLEQAGKLLRVRAPLSADFELAAALWELRDGPTVVFEQVEGYRTPVVANLLNTRDKLDTVLGLSEPLQDHLLRALANPVEPVVLDEGPCLEVTHAADVDLTSLLPVPRISEHDGGRYISAGVLVARDPATGRLNLAICRMQVQGPGRIGVYMAPTHSRGFLEQHRRAGTRMEVAVAVGLHPALMVSSQFLTPLDETHVAGAVLGSPMELVRARTVDLEVPAHAEVIIEGVIDPGESEAEGPFGEFPGTYAPQRPNPVIRVSAVSTRAEPLFTMIVGGRHPEHLVTGAIAREAGLLTALRAVVPGVREVRLTEGGNCRFHLVVSMEKRFAGEPRTAMLAAFAAQDLVKHVTVVDTDIDLDDPVSIEWAVATRMRAEQDVLVVPGMKSNPVDQMSSAGTISKMGIDATLPLDAPPDARQVVGVPAEVRDRVRARWSEIVGDEPGRG
jgi:2,5-furandicarboxylate decarboxylase 1